MKKNIFYLISLLILAFAVYKFGYLKQKEIAKKPKNRIFTFDEKNVTKWEAEFDGQHIVCEKLDGVWWITSPIKTLAEKNEAFANVKNFNTMDFYSIVATNHKNLKRWGLDRASNKFTVYVKDLKGRQIPHTFWQGAKTVSPKGFYATYNQDSNVYTLEYWIFMALKKDLTMLRSRKLNILEPEEIKTLSYKNIKIKKKGLYWTVNNLNTNQVNTKEVDQLVQAMGFLTPDKVYLNKSKIKDFTKNKLFTVTTTGLSEKFQKVLTNKFTFYNKNKRIFTYISGHQPLYELTEEFNKIFPTNINYFKRTNTKPSPVSILNKSK